MQLRSWENEKEASNYGQDVDVSPLDPHNVKLLDNVHPLGWEQPPERMKKYRSYLKVQRILIEVKVFLLLILMSQARHAFAKVVRMLQNLTALAAAL